MYRDLIWPPLLSNAPLPLRPASRSRSPAALWVRRILFFSFRKGSNNYLLCSNYRLHVCSAHYLVWCEQNYLIQLWVWKAAAAAAEKKMIMKIYSRVNLPSIYICMQLWGWRGMDLAALFLSLILCVLYSLIVNLYI